MTEKFTFFGSKKIPLDIKNTLVDNLFSNVSDKYDLMNDLMSVGIHRIWKDKFVSMLENPSAKLLDMAGGTCDIAKRFYQFSKNSGCSPDITVCDLNLDMMLAGRKKLLKNNISDVDFVNAKAEELPFKNNLFDYYTVSFGIRNFADMSKSLKEAHRVINKGGKLFCLEFSKPQNKLVKQAYDIYSNLYIPSLGGLMGDKDSYQYLVESIEKFPSQEEFCKIIEEAGFKNVSYQNMSNGIVAIHMAEKL